MAVFFNGQLLISPAVASVVDDSAMANRNLSVPNVLALVGSSTGGEPNVALRFGSPAEAKQVLRSGVLMDAVVKAFAPSAQVFAPATVVAIRVNPAVRATLNLVASAVTMLTLTSTDYGLWNNGIKVKVETGTTKGKRLTSQVGDAYYTADDVARNAISVLYSGIQASATISVTNSTVTLAAPSGSVVATIALSEYPTVAALADRINAVTGFAATVQDGSEEKPSLNGLDSATTQPCKTTAYMVTANLQAVVDWFNSVGEGYVTATRAAGAGTVPDNIGFTYLASGSDGTITATEWSNAFSTLQSEDVQWVVPLSSDASIHAQADAHCIYMSNVGKMERRCFVGGATGQTLAQAIAAAKLINSDRTALVFPGHYDYSAAGLLELRPSYMSAAVVAAGFAGSNPGRTMTNKAMTLRGLETKLRNPTDTDLGIEGGVLCLEESRQGYRVTKAVTTWLINDNYNRVEVSTGAACDFTVRNVRNAVAQYIGEPGNPITLSLVKEAVETALSELSRPEPSGPGVLVGDAESPPYKNITVSLSGDVIRVEFQASPVIPANYILITFHAVPYSGTITA